VKHKFMLLDTCTIGDLMNICRNNLQVKLDKEAGLFLLINNNLVPASKTISEVFVLHKDPDCDVLIVNLCKENTFG
jgi:hypothetical protein